MEISHEPEEETRVLVSSQGSGFPVIVLHLPPRYRLPDVWHYRFCQANSERGE